MRNRFRHRRSVPRAPQADAISYRAFEVARLRGCEVVLKSHCQMFELEDCKCNRRHNFCGHAGSMQGRSMSTK